MKLLVLNLHNFQGVKEMEISPNGKDLCVFGTNASGKTTLYNAYTWLLFEKASTGEAGYSPKPINADGKEVHGVTTSVEGVFEGEDGGNIRLKKELSENWVKKKGSLVQVFSGNTINYFVNNVPCLKKEYDAKLSEFFTSEQAAILTQYNYFAETIPWQKRREILLDICGNVSDEEVIDISEELAELREFLQNGSGVYTVEEFQKIAAAQKRQINETLEKLPLRIDEAERAVPQDLQSQSKLEKTLAELEAEKAEAENAKAQLSQGEAEATLRRQIVELRTDIANARCAYEEEYRKTVSGFNMQTDAINGEIEKIRPRVSAQRQLILSLESELEKIEAEREKLTKEYTIVKSQEWAGDEICPTCKRPLPADEVEKAKADFNKNKAERLENIRNTCENECSKTIIAVKQKLIEETQKTLDKLQDDIKFNYEEIKRIEAEKPKHTPFEEMQSYADLTQKIKDIQTQIDTGDTDSSTAEKALDAKIATIKGEISKYNAELIKYDFKAQQEQRIEQLCEEEKQLNIEYEKFCNGVYLCELFTKTKVSLLTENINYRFKNVRFKLFEEQINGGIKECCEVLIPCDNGLVGFASANNAARINAGLEIIDTISAYYGIELPVFVDNAESVVKVVDIRAQTILLIVSAADKKLRIEAAK